MFDGVGSSVAITGIGFMIVIAFRVLLSGFVTVVVGTAVIGRRQTVGQVWTATRPRLLPLVGLGDGLSFGTDMLATRYLIWSTIGVVVASTLTEPFIAATTVLLYTDQRIRREGLAAELASVANR